MPELGGGVSPVEWLRSMASGDRGIKANARAKEAEAIADWIEAVVPHRGLPETRPLRRCGYCQTWQRRPCGDGCYWSFRDPTFEMLEAEECGNRAQSARDRDGGSAGDAEGGSTAKQRQPGPKASPK